MNLFFSTVNFIKSKDRSSISNEKLARKLRCAVKYTLDFKDLMWDKKNIKYLNSFYIDCILQC